MFLQSLIIIYAGFNLFGNKNTEIISYSLILISVIIIASFLFTAPGDKFLLPIEPFSNFPKGYSALSFKTNSTVLFLYITLFVIAIYMISIGLPGFQHDAASAKLRVNSNPVYSRFIRVILPVSIVVYGSAFRRLPSKKFLFFTLILLLATGFKGYVISFLLIPVMTVLYFLNRLSLTMIALLVLVALLLLYVSTWIVIGVQITEFFPYLMARATVSQSESLMVIFSDLSKYEKFPVFYQSFLSVFNRLGFEFVSLNEQLFTDLHGSNPYRMQLAIPAIIEVYLKIGYLGAILFLVTFSMLIIFLEKRLRLAFINRKFVRLAICYIVLVGCMDFFSNGNVASKVVDMILSSIFFYVVYITLSFKVFRSAL